MEHFSFSYHRSTVLCRKKKGITISEIFKPTDKGEAERIKKEGGFVTTNGRVGGVLAVSRALGDIAFQPFVSPIPGIRKYVPISFNNLVIMFLLANIEILDRYDIEHEDDFVILGCDGVWDVYDEQQAVDMLMSVKVACMALVLKLRPINF